METITPKPEIGAAHAAQRNYANFPPIISEIQSSFGQEKVPVYIYNISQEEFNFPRYPNHPHMLIRACPKGQPWILAGQITHPFDEVRFDQNGKREIHLTNGWREATAMLNPDNPGIDQEYNVEGLHQNGNLNRYGVFWSSHNPPLPEELAAAKRRLEETYKKLLQDMAAWESRDPADARDRATRTAHYAADYFGVSTSWHRLDLIPKNENVGKVDCSVCGEKIQPNAKLCVHCGAPTDVEMQKRWLDQKFRGPGRPPNAA
jgi:RNA polymerase-binding transcription factor DksA